jgi:poly(U)-specific endoribonuclease
VDEAAISSGTWGLFRNLLDNYERSTGVQEVITSVEKKEESLFLDACLRSPVMDYCYNWLKTNRKIQCRSKADFKNVIHQKWFQMYSRERGFTDSSGFEHVFLGEEKAGKVTGFHNWVQLFLEEKAGRLDYLGYIKPRVRGRSCMQPSEYEQLVTLQFRWEDEVKDVSSSYIGTSPEFELALYSLCFFGGEEHNFVMTGPYRAEITCYTQRYRGKTYIGSSFPSAAPMTEDQGATKLQSAYRGKRDRAQTSSRRR